MKSIKLLSHADIPDSQFVQLCETEFDRKLDSIAHRLVSELADSNSRIISLSGPTCAGKTTVARKLTQHFSTLGKTVITVSIDDYYVDQFINRSHRSERIDMESVKNIDLPELEKTVNAIKSNTDFQMPIFDFKLGMRTGYRNIDVCGDCLFMFEGIQSLYPEISSVLGTEDKNSVFICPDTCIDTGKVLIYPNKLRLMRRIVRDEYFRGSSPEFTINVWQSVRDNEEKNIFPYAQNIGLKIDSTMGYEPGIIATRLKELLTSVGYESSAYTQAQTLLDELNGVEPVSPEYLSPNSLYWEFLKK